MSVRVAYVGPTPAGQGGVPYMAGQLLLCLADAGFEVEAHLAGRPGDLPDDLAEDRRLSFAWVGSRWQHDRWYSSHALSRYASGQFARGVAQRGALDRMAAAHAVRPFDLIYQFSQVEMRMPRLHGPAPAHVIHPEVHAAGELRWHRREAALSRAAEHRAVTVGARGMLAARAAIQGRFLRRADGIVAPSAVFGELLVEDHGLDPQAVHVIPNVVDVERFAPGSRGRSGRRALLFVSRMAVRKGVELVVALSHRLADLADEVEIQVIGDHGVWSDYRRLLDGLDPSVATVLGGLPAQDVAVRLQQATALLQPSHYEPFALTVGEALASGTPVVVSDAVGAGEGIDAACCRTFAAGDLDGFEQAVRRLLADLDAEAQGHTAQVARSEALRSFARPVVALRLAQVIDRVLGADALPRVA